MAEQQTEQPKEQTLDDVYAKFNVEAAAQEFKATPAAPVTPSAPAAPQIPVVPDPALDVDGFRKYIGGVVASDHEIRQTLHSINERLSQAEQERIRGQEEADLKAAVSKVKAKVDLDDDFLEVALAHRAKRDEKFMNLWVNRSKKPEAWQAALDVVANDIGKKFSARTDPQLAENQRAMKVSRDQMATTQKPDPNEKWTQAIKDGNFDQLWEQAKNGA